jgi:MFS family permease
MQGVAAAWLMTSLAPSPVMVSLVQVAATFPMFLLALPAGALADIIDRRRLLLVSQVWMLSVAAVLGLLTIGGITTPWILIGFTFALGVGASLNGPAWQAIVLDVVKRDQLLAAVSLNSAGFNIARAVGPTLGGFAIASMGTGAVFLLNAASFIGIIGVLFRWRRPRNISALPAERIIGAIRTGVRYVRHAPVLRAVLIRTVTFVVFASVWWPLLPLIARFELQGGPSTYGILVGFFGAGSVAGAMMLPRLRRFISADMFVIADSLVFSAVLFTLAFVRSFGILCAAMALGGVVWLTLLSSFNSGIQSSAPLWVRGRALSVYLLVFFGSLSGGNALWGAVAKYTSIRTALVAAGIGMIAALLVTKRHVPPSDESKDLAPATDWETPVTVGELDPEQGPVVIMVEYRIAPENTGEFLDAMRDVRLIRRRDGAVQWGLTRDIVDPARYVEFYVTESWVEHLRQHERLTVADRAVFEKARLFHIGEEPPVVSHFVFAYEKEPRE